MTGRQCRQVHDDGVHGVGADQEDQASLRSEATRGIRYLASEIPVRDGVLTRDECDPVAVLGEFRGEGHREARGASASEPRSRELRRLREA